MIERLRLVELGLAVLEEYICRIKESRICALNERCYLLSTISRHVRKLEYLPANGSKPIVAPDLQNYKAKILACKGSQAFSSDARFQAIRRISFKTSSQLMSEVCMPKQIGTVGHRTKSCLLL